MNREDYEAKLVALLENTEFTDKLKDAKSNKEIEDMFTKEGLEFGAEDLQMLLSQIDNDEELSEQTLESVSGGGSIWDLLSKALDAVQEFAPGGKYYDQAFKVAKKYTDWRYGVKVKGVKK